MPRGGKREGAGRKPRDKSGPVAQVSVWLTPAEQERLAAIVGVEKGPTNGQVFLEGIKAFEAAARRKSKQRV